MRCTIPRTLLAVSLIAICVPALRAGVVPAGTSVDGKTQAEWSAAWWQHITSIPLGDNPMFDETGAKAHVGQSGSVFFLVGKFAFDPNNTATRPITISPDKFLFFPLVNVEDDNLFYDPPKTEAELRAGLASQLEGVTLFASVDGTDVPNLTDHRAISPVFEYTLPEDNVYDGLGIPQPAQTITGAVGDGFYLMLEPLPPGDLEVRFGGTFAGDPTRTVDITYQLAVVPLPAPLLIGLSALPLAGLLRRRIARWVGIGAGRG